MCSDSNPVVWLEHPRLGSEVDGNDPRAPDFHCRTDYICLRVRVYKAVYSSELPTDSPAQVLVLPPDLGNNRGGGSSNDWISAAAVAAMQVRRLQERHPDGFAVMLTERKTALPRPTGTSCSCLVTASPKRLRSSPKPA